MKKPSKQTVETLKTVLIAVLITGIVAFVGGMKYQSTLISEEAVSVHNAVAEIKTAISPKE